MSEQNKALDAESPIASFFKSLLIGGGPVNASVRPQEFTRMNDSNISIQHDSLFVHVRVNNGLVSKRREDVFIRTAFISSVAVGFHHGQRNSVDEPLAVVTVTVQSTSSHTVHSFFFKEYEEAFQVAKKILIFTPPR